MARSQFQPLRYLAHVINVQLDPRSLQCQLTLSITVLMALGLGGVALWTRLKMQQILIESHKDQILEVIRRVRTDVDLYSEMFPVQTSVSKAINNRTASNQLMWAIRKDGSQLATSTLQTEPAWKQVQAPSTLALMAEDKGAPIIYYFQDRVFVACQRPLVVQNQTIGQLYLAQDITSDQQKLTAMVHTLAWATVLAMGLTTGAISLYSRLLLRPLKQMCKSTNAISAEDLGKKQFHIPQAPSEIRQLAATFNLMLDRLSEAWQHQRYSEERQRQFVSNASHELRTPLTIISGYLQSTLRRAHNLSDSQREALSIASSEAEHTIRLLQDLLDLARADDGYVPMPARTVILNDVITDVIGRAEQYHRHPIRIEGSDATITVDANPDRLQQVLVNLVENAIKYSQPGEPVTVKLSQQGQQAKLQVCDRGCGIPLKQQSRIFERFYRLDEARTRSTGGSGLGLSIVKTFVESMGGQVSVRSQPGKGSTFTVILPISPKLS